MEMTFKLGDKTINRLGFGAMRITGEGIWGPPKDHAEAVAVLKRAVELGVDLIDTADAYGPEVSEELIREALYPYEGLVIATKGGLTRTGPGMWPQDGRPEHIREACEASLKRLGVNQIEVYQFHRPDPRVPYIESVGTFFDLQKEGKVRHVGVSNVTLDQLKQALELGEVVSAQNRYSLFDRSSEEVLRYCEERGIGFMPWYPIGGESGEYGEAVLQKIADTHDASPRQVALAWLLAHSPVMLPIPGTGSVAHLEENMQSTKINLTADELAELDSLKG
jgi:pyridoxine 4-dehydrogenase